MEKYKMKKNKNIHKIIEIINNEGYQIDRQGVEYLKTITYSKNTIKHLNQKNHYFSQKKCLRMGKKSK